MKGLRKNFAVLTTALDAEVQVRLLKGIGKLAKQQHCNIAVFNYFTGAYEKEKHNLGEVNILNLPDLNLFDGVIVVANVFHLEINQKIIGDLLKKVHVPVVTIGVRIDGCYYVGADNYTAMYQLVEHFIEHHGMRRLHFVTGTDGNTDSEERFRAYRDVLKKYDIPYEEERVTHGDFYIAGGEAAAYQIMHSQLPFPEAVICANDTMAITLSDILHKKGYSLPTDLAISGYDCTREGRQCTPILTSVRLCTDKQGEAALQLLLDISNGKEVPSEILVPDEPRIGESCGCENLDIYKRYRTQRKTISQESNQRNSIYHMLLLEKEIMEGESYQHLLHALKNFIVNIDPSEFYYCTNQDMNEKIFQASIDRQENMSPQEQMAYSENVDVQLAYKNGAFFTKEAFPSKQALDQIFTEEQGGKIYIFSPIHYLERNFGYVVFVDSDFTVGNVIYVNWLINMGHSMENIRKQQMLYYAVREMDNMYIHDSLTGVYNRFGMERICTELEKEGRQTHKLFFLAFIDADELKEINDKFGHEMGDYAIRSIAKILDGSDYPFQVARYGGDEFVVMGLVSDESEVISYWNQIEHIRETHNQTASAPCQLDFSYGYQLTELTDNVNLLECISNADQRMYSQKNRKKHQDFL